MRPVIRDILPLAKGITTPPIYQQPFSARFQDQNEHRYFNVFSGKTAYHLGGFYDGVLWKRIVLQAAELDPSIRHCVMAIGALDMTTSKMAETKTFLGQRQTCIRKGALNVAEGKPGITAEEHNLFALKSYSRAVKEMREAALKEKHDLRTKLLASILIICFETYHGYYDSAARQVRTSVKLLEEAEKKKKSYGMTQEPIEDELVRVFDRLDVQLMSHTDQFLLDEHKELKNYGEEVIENMPAEFATISDARRYFNMIVRRVAHFGCMFWKLDQDSQSSQKPSLSHFDLGARRASEDMLAEYGKYMKESERWMAAFLPLFQRTKVLASSAAKESLAPLTLRMHFLAMHVTLMHLLDTEEVVYDNNIDDFVEMVALGKSLLQDSDWIFTFDLQSVLPLDIVAKKCRDPLLRREAIRLLVSRPRREGIWDSLLAAKICTWIVQIEEEGLVDGFVPEQWRARQIGVKLNLENQKADVWCFLPGRGGESDKIKRATTLSW